MTKIHNRVERLFRQLDRELDEVDGIVEGLRLLGGVEEKTSRNDGIR